MFCRASSFLRRVITPCRVIDRLTCFSPLQGLEGTLPCDQSKSNLACNTTGEAENPGLLLGLCLKNAVAESCSSLYGRDGGAGAVDYNSAKEEKLCIIAEN